MVKDKELEPLAKLVNDLVKKGAEKWKNKKYITIYKPKIQRFKFGGKQIPVIGFEKQKIQELNIKLKIPKTNILIEHSFNFNNSVSTIIEETINNAGPYILVDKKKIKPVLLDSLKRPYGWKLIYELPPGIAYHEFEQKIRHFADATGGWVESVFENKRALLRVYLGDFKSHPYEFNYKDYPKMQIPIPIGFDRKGELIVVDLSDLPHLMVAGAPGYGKTSAVRGIVTAVLPFTKVIIIDFKKVDFSYLKGAAVIVASTESEALKTTKWMYEEYNRRLDMYVELGGNTRIVNKLARWHQFGGKHMEYIVFIVDEIAEIQNKQTLDYILSIARLGRAPGVSIVAATQYPSTQVIDSNTRRQFLGKLCFVVENDTASNMIIDNPLAARIRPTKGRAIWKYGMDCQEVQTMYLDEDIAPSLAYKVVSGGDTYSYKDKEELQSPGETRPDKKPQYLLPPNPSFINPDRRS